MVLGATVARHFNALGRAPHLAHGDGAAPPRHRFRRTATGPAATDCLSLSVGHSRTATLADALHDAMQPIAKPLVRARRLVSVVLFFGTPPSRATSRTAP